MPLLIFFLFINSFSFAKGVYSSTVAQVAGKVLTTRDVQIFAYLEHWYLIHDRSHGKITAKDWVAVHDDLRKAQFFRKELATLLAESLVVAEAENFAVAQTSPTVVSGAVQQFKEDVQSNLDWHDLEVTTAELELAIARHLRSREFIRFKAESLGFQVSDQDAQAYYLKNQARFNYLPFAEFKDSIKEYLTTLDVQEKMKDWFDVLRKKYKVKTLKNVTLPAE